MVIFTKGRKGILKSQQKLNQGLALPGPLFIAIVRIKKLPLNRIRPIA